DLEPIAQDEAARRETGERGKAAAELAHSLGEGRQLTPRLLMQTLRRGEVPLFEAMLAEMSALRPELIHRLCYEPGGQGLAIISRAVGLSREEFASVYLLTRKARPGTAADPADLGRAL